MEQQSHHQKTRRFRIKIRSMRFTLSFISVCPLNELLCSIVVDNRSADFPFSKIGCYYIEYFTHLVCIIGFFFVWFRSMPMGLEKYTTTTTHIDTPHRKQQHTLLLRFMRLIYSISTIGYCFRILSWMKWCLVKVSKQQMMVGIKRERNNVMGWINNRPWGWVSTEVLWIDNR